MNMLTAELALTLRQEYLSAAVPESVLIHKLARRHSIDPFHVRVYVRDGLLPGQRRAHYAQRRAGAGRRVRKKKNSGNNVRPCQMPAHGPLGLELEKLRLARGLSRAEAAGLVGIKANSWRALEVGRAYPKEETLARIALAFDTDPAHLLALAGPPPRRATSSGRATGDNPLSREMARWRKDRGMSRSRAADVAGIHKNTWMNAEAGAITPTEEIRAKLRALPGFKTAVVEAA